VVYNLHVRDGERIVDREQPDLSRRTVRVITASGRAFILKQGRPWVEKHPQIAAPVERTTVEAGFNDAVPQRGLA
jgi:5-methylthioribose kinase